MLTDPAFMANPRKPRRRERPWKQPRYISLLHDLPCVLSGRCYVEAHHLIHHKRRDRRRRDDRLALPLSVLLHSDLHRSGGESRYLQERGIPDPYALGEELWQIYRRGWDRDEAIRAIINARAA